VGVESLGDAGLESFWGDVDRRESGRLKGRNHGSIVDGVSVGITSSDIERDQGLYSIVFSWAKAVRCPVCELCWQRRVPMSSMTVAALSF